MPQSLYLTVHFKIVLTGNSRLQTRPPPVLLHLVACACRKLELASRQICRRCTYRPSKTNQRIRRSSWPVPSLFLITVSFLFLCINSSFWAPSLVRPNEIDALLSAGPPPGDAWGVRLSPRQTFALRVRTHTKQGKTRRYILYNTTTAIINKKIGIINKKLN